MILAFPFTKTAGKYDDNLPISLCFNNKILLENIFSDALGQGWRVGFLGLLHMDVFCQRLEQEFDASVIITSPNVPFKGEISF